MLYNHMFFNSSEVKKIISKDAIYLASIRDPQEVFISGLYFFGGRGVNELKKSTLSDEEAFDR